MSRRLFSHASMTRPVSLVSLFFFNDTATTEIYTLSLHDALPISRRAQRRVHLGQRVAEQILHVGDAELEERGALDDPLDRKSTRLNSSHLVISYAVFCLKKKKQPLPLPIVCHSPTCYANDFATTV